VDEKGVMRRQWTRAYPVDESANELPANGQAC
jgi:hypothetical protein